MWLIYTLMMQTVNLVQAFLAWFFRSLHLRLLTLAFSHWWLPTTLRYALHNQVSSYARAELLVGHWVSCFICFVYLDRLKMWLHWILYCLTIQGILCLLEHISALWRMFNFEVFWLVKQRRRLIEVASISEWFSVTSLDVVWSVRQRLLNIPWMVLVVVLISVCCDKAELWLISVILIAPVLINIIIPGVYCLLLRCLFWLRRYRLTLVYSALNLVFESLCLWLDGWFYNIIDILFDIVEEWSANTLEVTCWRLSEHL